MKLVILVLNTLLIDDYLRQAIAIKPPRWDPIYTLKGVMYISDAEIEEPFQAFFDKHGQRSRIDYYDGTTKTYQLSRDGEYGRLFKIIPVTTDDETNQITCFQINGTRHHRVKPQPILPDCADFYFAGKDELLGWKCYKFEFEEIIDENTYNIHTMWVRYVKSPRNSAISKPIPVRYDMRGYDTLFGIHDHYHLDYNFYSNDDIPDKIFRIKHEPCDGIGGFPDSGVDDASTFNPMKEFIHPTDSSHIIREHTHFIRKHSIVYATPQDHLKRRKVFMQNYRFIQSKNREHNDFTLTVNHLADKTKDEFKSLRGLKPSGEYNGGQLFPHKLDEKTLADLPENFDWRIYGAVTPIKDQSTVCGSCWSFSSTGAIEGALFLHNGGKLIHLSQQALIDCSWNFDNYGCDGGENFRAYEWVRSNGGIPTEESYGNYKAQDGFCHVKDSNVTLVAPITGWVNVTRGNVNAMKVALFKHGPINVAIDASQRTFGFYSHGVYYEPKCGSKDDDLNHTVLIVGYGKMNGKEYWLVKNSWGNLWGINGYILMSTRNCGVLNDGTYVTF